MAGTGMRGQVLIVDDDDSNRFVLRRTLERLGLDVIAADDGADVPDLIGREHFDLLVLDLYMPCMNGFEVLRQVRRRDPGLLPRPRTLSTVPVLVVSGETHPASVSNAKALGADDYVRKPLDVDVFERVVRRLLRRTRDTLREA
jgi:CheY-like chemotaxis protein